MMARSYPQCESQCPGGHFLFGHPTRGTSTRWCLRQPIASQCPGGHFLFGHRTVGVRRRRCRRVRLNALAGIFCLVTASGSSSREKGRGVSMPWRAFFVWSPQIPLFCEATIPISPGFFAIREAASFLKLPVVLDSVAQHFTSFHTRCLYLAGAWRQDSSAAGTRLTPRRARIRLTSSSGPSAQTTMTVSGLVISARVLCARPAQAAHRA